MQTFVEARQATAVPGDRRFARVLRRWTEGNPYFAIEILNHMAERGAVHEDGLRSLGSESLADLDIPASVRVIERRLALLSEQSRQILGIAATLGRDFEVTLLSDVTAVDSQPLDDALREAEEAELIISFPHGDLYRFAHALVRETLYSELTARRRRQLHEQVGEWLEARHGESAEHAAELAYHFARAGADAKAFPFRRTCRSAGRGSSRLGRCNTPVRAVSGAHQQCKARIREAGVVGSHLAAATETPTSNAQPGATSRARSPLTSR